MKNPHRDVLQPAQNWSDSQLCYHWSGFTSWRITFQQKQIWQVDKSDMTHPITKKWYPSPLTSQSWKVTSKTIRANDAPRKTPATPSVAQALGTFFNVRGVMTSIGIDLSLKDASCRTESHCWNIHGMCKYFSHSFIHSFLPSFIHSFLPSFLPSFLLPSFLPSFLHSFFHSFIPSFLPSFIHSIIHSFIQSGRQSGSQAVRQSVSLSCIQSLSRSVSRSFISVYIDPISINAICGPPRWRTIRACKLKVVSNFNFFLAAIWESSKRLRASKRRFFLQCPKIWANCQLLQSFWAGYIGT